jgi:ACS family tartrate transporter-like MFS transporter
MCVLLAFYGIALWLPQIVRSIGHLTIFATGFVSAVPYVCAAVGSILVGRHSDRTGERAKHVAYPAFVGALAFVLAAFAPSPAMALLGLSIGATGIWCSNAIFWTIPAARLSGVAAAAGFALINSVGNLGGFFGPYLTGWIRETTGKFSLTLVVLGISLALSGAIVLLVGKRISQTAAGRRLDGNHASGPAT